MIIIVKKFGVLEKNGINSKNLQVNGKLQTLGLPELF